MPASVLSSPPSASAMQLVFEAGAPGWLLSAAGAALLLMQLAHLRWACMPGAKRRWRLTTAAARLVGCLVLLWALAGPVLRLQRGEAEPRRIGVVLDNSRSMLQHHAGGEPRRALAQKIAERMQAAAQGRADEPALTWFNLAGPCASPEVCLQAGLGHTPLLASLQRAALEDGHNLAALVLLSDGQDTERSVDSGAAMSATEQRLLSKFAAPVTTITLTDAPTHFDWRVEDVQHDPFVFVKTTTHIDCVLGRGGAAQAALAPVQVQLLRGGQVLQQKALQANQQESRPRVGFSIRAEEVGEHIFACRIVPPPGELTARNNQRAFVLRVLRDKVRVLHVVGRPSWDERFLRQELKANRNIDVISFFILRTPDDDISIPEGELSLIPFPVARLFTSELRNFDVVILQNFDFRPYHMGQYLENLRDAVRTGLGLVMLGGPESFADGGYLGTPLEEVLPLQLQLQGGKHTEPEKASLRSSPHAPVLTRAGAYHPLLDFGVPVPRAQLLRSLPPIRGLTALGDALPGAQILLEAQATMPHVTAGAANQAPTPVGASTRWPLLAARDVGRGRSLSVASDGLWRWRFTEPGVEGAGKLYARLWHNAWRWLTHDPELSRLHLTTERAVVEASGDGALLTGSVRALGRDWQPLPGAHVWLRLVPHPNAPFLAEAGAQAAQAPTAALAHAPVQLALDDDGLASWRFAQVPAGVWRIEAALATAAQGETAAIAPFAAVPSASAPPPADNEAQDETETGGESQQRAATTIVVQPAAEDMRLLANPNWMASIAKASGGAALSASSASIDVLQKLVRAPAPPMRVSHQEDVRAWQHPIWVVLFVAAWSLAWALSRRLGGR